MYNNAKKGTYQNETYQIFFGVCFVLAIRANERERERESERERERERQRERERETERE